MTTLDQLLHELRDRGFQLRVDLHVRSKQGAHLDTRLREAIREHRFELVQGLALSQWATETSAAADSGHKAVGAR